MNYIARKLYLTSPFDMVEELATGIKMFRHPLYVCPFFEKESAEKWKRDMRLPTPDEIVVRKYADLLKAEADCNVLRYVFIHERPWRFAALLDAEAWADPHIWFQAAGDVWLDSEGPGINTAVWRMKVFDHPFVRETMDNVDLEFLESLPDTLTVYRGADSQSHARRGLSWTLDREQAIWFARRYSTKTPYLAEVTISKEDISAAYVHRGEQEIVISRILSPVNVTKL